MSSAHLLVDLGDDPVKRSNAANGTISAAGGMPSQYRYRDGPQSISRRSINSMTCGFRLIGGELR
ncbi:hypothetical protein ACWDKQ_22405 [Saccharopolyspora sp. NPDC000995]